jgi:hypothetical protein
MFSTIRLSEVDFWIFPDMTKLFNKANIVFAGFDHKRACNLFYIKLIVLDV